MREGPVLRPQQHTGDSRMAGLVLVGVIIVTAMVIFQMGFYTVPERYVAVTFRAGALVNKLEGPGYHWKIPFLDSVEFVQVTMQTDSVRNIPCGTSGGVIVYFDKIEVVNRLKTTSVLSTVREYGVDYDRVWIFDKIHHEMNQFCSKSSLAEVYIEKFDTLDELMEKSLQDSCDKYNTGIEIIAVRVTKPRIPEAIRKSYEDMEAQKTQLLISTERQKVVEREAETERKKARIEAEKNAEVSRINMEKEIQEKESKRKIAEIEDSIQLAKSKAQTDSQFYRALKEAQANKLHLSREFLQLELIRSIANNTKIYYGEKIPSVLFELPPFLQAPSVHDLDVESEVQAMESAMSQRQ